MFLVSESFGLNFHGDYSRVYIIDIPRTLRRNDTVLIESMGEGLVEVEEIHIIRRQEAYDMIFLARAVITLGRRRRH